MSTAGQTAHEGRELSKRPVAFRVPRLINYGTEASSSEYRIFIDEDEARIEANAIGVDYEGLYLVADRRCGNGRCDQSPTITHDDLCALSRCWNENHNRAHGADYRVNKWLKRVLAESSQFSKAPSFADNTNNLSEASSWADPFCMIRDMWQDDECPSWPQVEEIIELLCRRAYPNQPTLAAAKTGGAK